MDNNNNNNNSALFTNLTSIHTVYVTLRYTGQTKRFLITTKLVYIYLGLRVVVVVAANDAVVFVVVVVGIGRAAVIVHDGGRMELVSK